MTNKVLCIGRIKEPKGLKGQFKITAFGDLLNQINQSDFSFNLYQSRGPQDGFLIDAKLKETCILNNIVAYKENLFLAFTEGISSPEDVARISSLYLGLPLDKANQLFADREDPFLFQYLGLTVVDAETPSFSGTVTSIRQHQGLNWLQVQIVDSEKPVLVPLQEPFVKSQALEAPLEIYQLKDLAEA